MKTEPTTSSEIAESVSDLSRVWIYQSSRELISSEIEVLSRKSTSFMEQWKAHGTKLKADYALLFNRFLCLFADESETDASGCSIDASVHFVKDLEKEFDIDFMNRSQVAVLDDTRRVKIYELNDLKSAKDRGEITNETLVFNNLVKTKGEMNAEWLLPINKSWHSRFLY